MNFWRRKMELEERVYKVLEDISGVKKPSKADMLLEELAFDSLLGTLFSGYIYY